MIIIDRNNKVPLYMQIYIQIRNEIMNEVLKEGEILPGSRSLARTLEVSRNTVDTAYSQLQDEGYIIYQKGSGFAVADLPKLDVAGIPAVHFNTSSTGKTVPSNPKVIYDLTNTSYTSNLFPKNLWRKFTLNSLDRLDSEEKMASSQDSQGELYLRRQLAEYLKRIRGIQCSPEQIIISCGLQQSLNWICTLLKDTCTNIIMEEPGYQKARAVFANCGYSISTVPVDANGIVTAHLPDTNIPCAVYTTPSHQFPTGVTLTISRRHELLKWAQSHKSYIIEDDYDSELRYYTHPIPALLSIDNTHNVIYTGTFSKALSPSVRMGYMILPHELMYKYNSIFTDYNCTVPLINQYVIAGMLESGEYDRHIRRVSNIYRKRLASFEKEFADIKGIKVSGNKTGQYFLLGFDHEIEQSDLINRALKEGVHVYSTMQFWHEKADCPPDSLFLGFSKIDLKDIPDCVNRLKRAWNL